jgi:hypothetical protein
MPKLCLWAANINFPKSVYNLRTLAESSRYAGISMAGILLMAGMALYGFYTSLGSRPVFGGAVFEE